jgi:flagellar hook-associated protein 2
VQQQLYASLQAVVSGAGRYKIFADVGVTLDDDTKISFDEDKFREAWANDPEAVKNLFTQATTGLGAAIENSMKKLIDPVDGAITRRNQTLDQQNQDYQDRIDRMDKQLDAKRTRLETQFANMETVLAKLQSQQQSLSSLSTVSAAK